MICIEHLARPLARTSTHCAGKSEGGRSNSYALVFVTAPISIQSPSPARASTVALPAEYQPQRIKALPESRLRRPTVWRYVTWPPPQTHHLSVLKPMVCEASGRESLRAALPSRVVKE